VSRMEPINLSHSNNDEPSSITREPRNISTNGQGKATSDGKHQRDAEDFDLAVAALDCLGDKLGLGSIRTAILVYDRTPVAISRSEDSEETHIVVGNEDELPGSLLARLRRTINGEKGKQ
jgi:hypothetical protein